MEKVDSEIMELLTDKGAFPASIVPAAASYLADLVLAEKPVLAVEVGCCHGFSTLHIGKALRELGGTGKLVSFDISPQEAEVRIRRAGLENFVAFVAGNSSREGARFFADKGQVIDFLFIDGDHTRRGCMRDAEAFLPHLKTGGIMILHDIYPERCGWLGPRYLINALQKISDTTFHPCFSIEEKVDFDPFGIAICRKQSEFPMHFLKSLGFMQRSYLSQFIEIANFEGKRSLWEVIAWGFSKWRRIANHW